MKRTNHCPGCNQPIPTRWLTYSPSKRDLRRCRHCHVLLSRVNTDIQPWTLIVLLISITPMVLALAGSFYFSRTGFVLSVAGAIAWMVVFDRLQFAYTNGYVQWHPVCRDCGYDMRHSPAACPECGGSSTRHPEDQRHQP